MDDRYKKLLYCDNGNKVLEVNRYGACLNNGDMLGVHDWGSEIKLSDIEEVVRKFTPIKHELYEKNEWSTRFWKVVKK